MAFALDVAAPLVECALKTDVSIPAFDRTSTNHPAMVHGTTGECGSIVVRKSWKRGMSDLLLQGSDNLTYAFKVCMTQTFGSCSKALKVIDKGAWPFFLDFVSFANLNCTDESVKAMCLISKAAKSEDLLAEASAHSIANL